MVEIYWNHYNHHEGKGEVGNRNISHKYNYHSSWEGTLSGEWKNQFERMWKITDIWLSSYDHSIFLLMYRYLRTSMQIHVQECWKKSTFRSYEFGKDQCTFYPVRWSCFAKANKKVKSQTSFWMVMGIHTSWIIFNIVNRFQRRRDLAAHCVKYT